MTNKPKLPPLPKAKATPPLPTKSAKEFTIESWSGTNRGKKILIYANSGMGKTSLSRLAPTPVFLGLDEGGSEIKDREGNDLKFIPKVKTFADTLAVLHNVELFQDYKTVVIDTATELEHWAVPHLLKTIPGSKGRIMSNIEEYGFKQGYGHLWDMMEKVIKATNELIVAGKNVIFTAQQANEKVANASGEDFYRDAPDLYSGYPRSVVNLFTAWADHVFKIDYEYVTVQDKKAIGSSERVIRVHPEVYYIAKSRTISVEHKTVSFENDLDDTIWKLVFGE